MKIASLKKLYFLGIGGIGMSAIARYFLMEGVEIHGYDIAKTDLTKKLEAEGMYIHYVSDTDKIPDDIDAVIMTPAIPEDFSELVYLRDHGYSLYKRSEVLGHLSREKRTIAVAGTHGKTTTSSLITHILKYCGLDITAFLGGILTKEQSNFIKGNSDYVVTEADEYDRSFLQLNPEILAIISMDADHLDIYGTVEDMYQAYEQLCNQIQPGGILLIEGKWIEKFSSTFHEDMKSKEIMIYDMSENVAVTEVKVKDGYYRFNYQSSIQDSKNVIHNVKTRLPGKHNIQNISVAITIGLMQNRDLHETSQAVENFQGIHRRFEYVYEGKRVLIDDYAHHPEELRHTVTTIKELYPDKKVLGIFQPHLFSRTQDFYRQFADELQGLNKVILMPIYPAREEPIEGIRSEIIYNLIPMDNKIIVQSGDELMKMMTEDDSEVIMTIGAANLNKYHKRIIELIK